MQIRKAKTEDAGDISNVLYSSFLELKPLYTEEGFAVTTPDRDGILRRMREGPIWAVLVNGLIVGTASVVPRPDGLYVRGMGVLPTARGMNIGRRLLELIESYALENGFSRLYLSTTPFLTRAIRLYEHFGFKRIKEETPDLHGTPLFSMEKYITKL